MLPSLIVFWPLRVLKTPTRFSVRESSMACATPRLRGRAARDLCVMQHIFNVTWRRHGNRYWFKSRLAQDEVVFRLDPWSHSPGMVCSWEDGREECLASLKPQHRGHSQGIKAQSSHLCLRSNRPSVSVSSGRRVACLGSTLCPAQKSCRVMDRGHVGCAAVGRSWTMPCAETGSRCVSGPDLLLRWKPHRRERIL